MKVVYLDPSSRVPPSSRLHPQPCPEGSRHISSSLVNVFPMVYEMLVSCTGDIGGGVGSDGLAC